MEDKRVTRNNLTERIPWKQAIIFGLVAFVVVFGLVAGLFEAEFMLQEDAAEVDTGEAEADDTPGWLTQRGWGVFGAHFVDLEASVTTGFGTATESVSVLNEWLEELPTPLFYLVPVGVLLSLGYLFGRRNMELIHSERDGAVFGATIAAGYLPAVLFSTFIFEWRTEINGSRVSYEIPLAEGALIAGIIFPLLFGAVGGYLAYSRE